MAAPVVERIPLPSPPLELSGLPRWAMSFVLALVQALQQYGYRLNVTLPKDGTERMTAPLPLRIYTVATRPAAASYTGSLIYVSDAAAGNKLQYSDGAAWIAAG